MSERPHDIGIKPTLDWIARDNLHVDLRYQRSISTKRGERVVKSIIEKFHWPLFQPLTITPRQEGGYWVIDGQHRLLAARRMGLPEIPVVIVEIGGTAKQAAAFVGINAARVNMTPLAIHHAMVVANDPLAVRLNECVRLAEVSIPKYPKALNVIKPHETMSLSSLKTAMKAYGDDALIWALRILRRAYPDEVGHIGGGYIRALSALYYAYADFHIHEKTMIDVVAEHMYTDFIKEGFNSPLIAAVSGIIEAYNEARPSLKPALPTELALTIKNRRDSILENHE